MTTTWDKQKIASLLSSGLAPNLAKPMKNKSVDAPTATIDVLITFDKSGVSSHPNHISLYHGARLFIASLIHNRPGWGCPVDLYTLHSVSLARKYTSFFDAMVSLVVMAFQPKQTGAHPSPLLFLNGLGQVSVGQKAMTTAHKSQIGWNFIGLVRYGWIGMSRYMFVNDLRLEKVTVE
jgi:N-acetylglucosaminylphosphatidylinositol deacetylase